MTDDVREKARELAGKLDRLAGTCAYRSPTIEAALREARNAALEEAAGVADRFSGKVVSTTPGGDEFAKNIEIDLMRSIPDQIRALKDK